MKNKHMTNNQENQNKTSAQKWISRYKDQLKRDNKYFSVKDWRTTEDLYTAYKVHLNVTKRWLSRLKKFRKDFEPVLNTQYARDFQERLSTPIEVFGERCRDYVDNPKNDILIIKDPKAQLAEVEFQTEIGKQLAVIDDALSLMQMDEETKSLDLPIKENKKISVVMIEQMQEVFPDIKEAVEKTLSRLSKADKDYLAKLKPLHLENLIDGTAPKYNKKLHAWEQEPVVLKYYLDELDKIKNGLQVDGFKMSNWLYFHTNFFRTDLPMSVLQYRKDIYEPNRKVKIAEPPLTDNELYYNDNRTAVIEGKKSALFMFGTRRFAKTVIESSELHFATLTELHAECTVVGGSSGDLGKLSKTIKISMDNINPAFKIENIRKDWGKEIVMGLKHKNNTEFIRCTIFIKNVNDRKSDSSETTAGSTPHIFICDEIGKFPFQGMWEAAKPSFQTKDGWNCYVLLTGTGGEAKLSKDAKNILSNPVQNDIHPMNWELLEKKYVKNKDFISWERRDFGVFVPSQMSHMSHNRKNVTTLGKFLGLKGEHVSKIRIETTDWEYNLAARNEIAAAKKNKKAGYDKFIMYTPVDPNECFLNLQENPFAPCIAAALKHQQDLIASGDTGREVELFRGKDGEIVIRDTDMEMVKAFPFEGGNVTAPVMIFQTPPENPQFCDRFPAGLDHYKHAKASTDSLGCLYIMRRKEDSLDDFSHRIVCSIASRPNTMQEFNETCHMMLDAYGSMVLQENVDISFQQYLMAKNLDSYYLAKGEKVSQSFINPKATQNNKYGLNSSKATKDYIMKLVADYCNEDILIGHDEDDVPITTKGVTRIPDIMLLEEILGFKYGENVDRITAFGHALAWSAYLDRMKIFPEEPEELEEHAYFNTRMKKERVMSPLSRTSIRQQISPYSSRMTGFSLFD